MLSPVGFCAVARAQGRAPDRLGSTAATNASEERRAEHRGAPLAGCAETRRATVARHQQPCPTGAHEHASLPASADNGNAPCTREWGIDTTGPGMAFPMARIPRHQSPMQRHDRDATGKAIRGMPPARQLQNRLQHESGKQRAGNAGLTKASGAPGQYGRNTVRVRSTRYPTRRVTLSPLPFRW